MAQTDEWMLIKRVLEGDRHAYAGLVREHHQEILRLCVSLVGDTARAEDVAQESFLRAYKALADFAGKSSFLTWISRIASNLCLEILRKEKRRREDSWDALVERLGEKAYNLVHESDAFGRGIERRDFIRRLLSELSPESRLALTLRELQGFSYKEISDAMGCSLDSVKARLRRARIDIIERLNVIDGVSADE